MLERNTRKKKEINLVSRRRRLGRGAWIGIFGALAAVIVATIITVVAINMNHDSDEEVIAGDTEETVTDDDGEMMTDAEVTKALMAATNFANEIQNKLNTDLEYTLEDALAAFEAQLESDDEIYRVYIAIQYAKYLYGLNGDAEMAIGILEENAGEITNETVALAYFVTIRDFYRDLENTEAVEYYDSEIIAIMAGERRTGGDCGNEDDAEGGSNVAEDGSDEVEEDVEGELEEVSEPEYIEEENGGENE